MRTFSQSQIAWTFLIAGLLCGVAGRGMAQVVAESIPGDPVTLASGKIAGKLLPSGIRAYLGVPFAAAPTGDLRWREPQPVSAWRGVYNADRFAPQCIQILRPHDINHYFGEEATSEDCLYLNVWTPASTPTAKLPVVVWIYGGGLSIGSASMANYSGENLAKQGVVYVAIAYRLGAFGFMAHPELTAESRHEASGNYGFLDQVAALQWIRSNIASFGGDPDRVTIMGQSAGAASAFNLQASPLARGLLHRIVGMSGGGLRAGADPLPLNEAEQSGLDLQTVLKVGSLAALRNVPSDRILAAQAEFQLGGSAGTVRFRPNIDGYFMPQSPREIFAAGRQNDVPLLIGFTRDESSNDLRTARSTADYRAAAQRYFGERATEFLRLYPVTNDADLPNVGAAAARDGGMATSIRSWAQGQIAKGRAPAYLYSYAQPHPYAPGVTFADHHPASAGAYHSSEIPYFLQTQDAYNRFRTTRNWTADDRQLADRLSGVIVEFARSGNPATSAVPMQPYDSKQEKLLELSHIMRVIAFDRARMNFFATVNLPGAVGPTATPRMPRD